MFDLTGQIAVVTGGGRGIGRAIVETLERAGVRVLTCGRGARPRDLPERILWETLDLGTRDAGERLAVRTQERLGDAKILINNAGVQVEKTVTESSNDDWDRLIGVNCRAIFECCRAFIPPMERTGGAIVNIGSISGHAADPSMALYNASKAFVHGLTRSIAVDHGPTVRCNAISPGWIMTGMADAAFDLAKDAAAAKRDALARHAAGRFGAPQDIANAALWLVSGQASFVTGQCFTIDGGLTAASPLQPGLF